MKVKTEWGSHEFIGQEPEQKQVSKSSTEISYCWGIPKNNASSYRKAGQAAAAELWYFSDILDYVGVFFRLD